MQVLALCGSLRAASLNAALLRTAARLAPPGIRVSLFDGMGALPLFNPDLDGQAPPAVRRLRDAVAGADALLIASPEYAHGVTGVIKTALDWLVSQEAFINKPVAVLNASPRAHHADAALRETLKTMSARVVEAASVSIPLLGSGMSESEMVEAPAVRGALKQALAALHGAVVLRLSPADASDFEALLTLRIAAMRESLERIGRFDPQRARERFAAGFAPEHTRHILLGGERVGFVVVRPESDGLLLDHLYIAPGAQGRGLGAAVLAAVFAQADAAGLPVRVGALRDSDSNRFYLRHGFEVVERAEFDNYYVRPARR